MKTHRWSLRWRVLSSLTIGFALLAGAFIIISYFQFRAYTISDCVSYAYGLNGLIADEIEIDHIEDYMTFGKDYPGYKQIEEKLYKLRNGYPNVVFLYVYQIREDGCHVVFDLDAEGVSASAPGTVEDFDPSFQKHLPSLLAGKEIPPIISNDSFGYLLTVYTPLYDSQGVCRCYVAVDYSMDQLTKYVNDIIRTITVLFLIVLILAFLLSAFVTDQQLVKPFRQLEARAYKDTLTGLQNRAAYLEQTTRLNALGKGANYSIVMADVNYLKRMNDEYGHEKGNLYLQNAAALLTRHFGYERVYRNGGDEFVILLEDMDHKEATELLLPFQEEMDKLQNDSDLMPWERISAATGIAAFIPGKDHTAEDVLKRADAAMYQNKLAMKAARA